MKKILYLIVVVVAFTSCGKLEDLNVNTKDFSVVKGEALFSNAQKNIVDQMVSTNVNYNIFRFFTQQWTETTYLDEVNYDIVTRTIPGNHWNTFYRKVLMNLDDASKTLDATPVLPQITGETPAIRQNKMATIEIMKVYSWSVLVQTFGNIPYTKALDIDNNPLPAYDDASTIYKDLIARLNVAIEKISVVDDGMGKFDNIYNGNMSKWLKFGNSLKLRMGMVISDSDPGLSRLTVESAATAGVITHNTDNASMKYLSSQPNTNPLFVDMVASGRNDFVPANTLVNAMNALNDPRLSMYFTQIDTSTVKGVEKLIYKGGKYGASNGFSAYSHVNSNMLDPTFPGVILDAAEVEFLLAEAIEKGFSVGGTAQLHYNNAITASILSWGGLQSDVDTYLASPEVVYTNASSGATYKQKIGNQAWIALYNRGWEAWQEWVRLDFPVFIAPATAKSAIPVRLIYPVSEQTLNGASYKASSAAIGGDLVTTKLFFDKF